MSLAPPKPSPLVPGYRLDRYELLCPIAEGGMASVWVARLQGKHGFEKLVAIKTILPRYASDLRFQQMFLDEARIASRIEHTNVAQILDLGEEHDVLYLVMEWVEGDALSKLQRAVERKNIPMPPGIVLRILADTCGGLHAAHELRGNDGALLSVVHRDVSPQNVLVSTRGVAKLIDFGIAKAVDRVAADTNAGFLKGKIQYMAPEQALGRTIDRRADVWAVGAILHHMLSGKPPYEGANQLATLHLLTSGKPPVPLPPRVPAAVSSVVRRALLHDPAKRYETALDLQNALENALLDPKLATTTGDVAAFIAEHLADRADARKQAVDMALAAARERLRMTNMLKPMSVDSGSGMPHSQTSVPRLDAPSSNEVHTRLTPPLPSSRDVLAQGPMHGGMQGAPISEISSATLGSAALESPMPPPAAGRRRVWPIALAGVVVLVGAGAVAMLAAIRMNRDGASAASQSPATTTTIAATTTNTTSTTSTTGNATPTPSTSATATASAATTATATTARPTMGGPIVVTPQMPPTSQTSQTSQTPATTAKPAPKKKAVDDGF